jgi:phosphoglycerol geranylgeranyltransferase
MNNTQNIFSKISDFKGIALLIDPDKQNSDSLHHTIRLADKSEVDYIFVGGSMVFGSINDTIRQIKSITKIPVILFPGNVMQISEYADAILFLSLISGRNPEFLIGHHVLAAPSLRRSGIEVIPTGYILIENGKTTSVEYMSNTNPIPAEKSDIIAATAIAGEMLGHKAIYLEAGSGAAKSVGLSIIKEVKSNITVPLIVGGGIRTPDDAVKIYNAGADLIVVGTISEEDPESIVKIAETRYAI